MAGSIYDQQASDDAARVQPNAAPAPSIYDQQADDDVRQQGAALRASLGNAMLYNPDEVARNKKLAGATQLPMSVVERNADLVATQQRIKENLELATHSPILRQQLMNPEFAKLAHDDTGGLNLLEKTMSTYVGASLKSGTFSLLGTGATLLNELGNVAGLTTTETEAATLFKNKPGELKQFMNDQAAGFLPRFARAMQDASGKAMDDVNPEAKKQYSGLKYATTDASQSALLSPMRIVGDVVQQIPQLLALMVTARSGLKAASIAGAEAEAAGLGAAASRAAAVKAGSEAAARAGAVSEGSIGYGQQYNQVLGELLNGKPGEIESKSPLYKQAIEAGYAPEAARLMVASHTADQASLMAGFVDAMTNAIGGRFLGKFITEGGAILPRVGKAFVTEGATEGVQSVGEQLGQNMATKANVDPETPLTKDLLENLVQGIVLGGLMGGGVTGIMGDHHAAQQAQEKVDQIKDIMDIAAGSKLRERDPQSFAEFAQQVNGETVHIDGARLQEILQTPEGQTFAQSVPAIAEQLQEALDTGGAVEIPLAQLVAHASGTGLEEAFLQNLRTSSEALSLAEAKDATKKAQTELAQEADRIIEQAADSAKMQSSTDAVRQIFNEQLTTANRFKADVNAAYSNLMGSFYTVLGKSLNISPEAAYKAYPYQVTARGNETDGVLNSAGLPSAVTETPEFKAFFNGSKVVNAEGGPQVLYHSTNAIPWGANNIGFTEFLTNTSEMGAHFGTVDQANSFGTNPTQRLMPVYLALRNPLRVADMGAFDAPRLLPQLEAKGIVTSEEAALMRTLPDDAFIDVAQAKIEAAGYDGLVYLNRREGAAEGAKTSAAEIDAMTDAQVQETYPEVRDSYVAFRPEQIKSAIGNNGNFDANNPSILEQSANEETEGGEPSPITQNEIPTTVDDTAALSNTLAIAKGKIWQTGRDLKMAIQAAVHAAASAAGVNVGVESPQTTQYLVRVAVKDALFALEQNANAIGWYDLKTRQALSVMALVHPEIATDENARMAFVWAMAVTSNGLKVGKNFELAEQVYRRYKQDGKMPNDVGIGTAGNAINDSLEMFNTLREAWGPDELRKFMLTDFTVGEITAINPDLKPGGEHAATTVRGAAILGPKIGNGFFSNLYGNFGALTMDRWLVRTWGRWTGTLIEPKVQQTAKAQARLNGVLQQIAADPAEATRLGGLIKLDITAGVSVDALANAVAEATQIPATREEMNKSAAGEELRKAGNSLAKYLDGQKEAPAGPTERNYIREVFGQVLDELRTTPKYADLTMADLQAVLWYAEKRLYESAKEDVVKGDEGTAGYEDSDAPDYANAAASVARTAGVTDRRIANALKKEEDNGRTATARRGDEPAQGQTVSGQQGTPAGFTRQEKRLFTGKRAVLRVRSNRNDAGGEPWSYARRGRADGSSPGLLKSLGVTWVAQWATGRAMGTVLRANGITVPKFLELAPGDEANAQRFADAITTSKNASGAIGAAVYVYPAGDYAAMRLFLSEDGKSGVAVKPDGDIVSVFSNAGAGRAVMELAIAAGGTKLDAFDTILPRFYAAHGFVATARLTWADDQAPEGWDKAAMHRFNGGQPDVVFMVYDPAAMSGQYSNKDGKRFEGDDAYDKALAAQQNGLRRVARAAKAAAGDGPVLNQSAEPNRYQATYLGDRSLESLNPDERAQYDALAPNPSPTLEQAARGTFNPKTLTTTLLKDADLSTFLHETGHFFLEVMAHVASQPNAPANMAQDMASVLKWFGIKSTKVAEDGTGEKRTALEVWRSMSLDEQRPYHEKFAESFEQYLFEGKSPSVEMQPLFQRFRQFMIGTYKTLTAFMKTHDNKLSAEVRGVFDRLIATDDEIDAMQKQMAYQALFEARPPGMTEEEWLAYQQTNAQATADAAEHLQKRSLGDLKWTVKARSKALRDISKDVEEKRKVVEAEVRAEVEALPVEKARTAIKEERASTPEDRAAVKDWTALRATVEADMVETVKAETMAAPEAAALKGIEKGQYLARNKRAIANEAERRMLAWEQENPRPQVKIADVDMDVIAERFGYSSGDELKKDMAAAPKAADLIEGLTDQRLLERFGDLVTKKGIEQAANEAVHNEARARALATELQVLTKTTSPTRVLLAAAKQFAATLVSRRKIRDLKPAQHNAAEVRAAKRAAEASAAGRTTDAIIAKRDQLLNFHAARGVTAALDEITRHVADLRKISDSTTLPADYKDQIDKLLERFDLRASTTLTEIDRRASLSAWIQSQEDIGIEVDLPQELIDNAQQLSYKDLTVEQFRGLYDTVKQIQHLGRLKDKLLTAKDKREFSIVRDLIADSIDANAGDRVADTRTPNTVLGASLIGLKKFWAAHIKTATLARIMDGGKDGGPVWEYLIRTANDAGNKEIVMRAKATQDLAALISPVLAQGKMGGKGIFYAGINRSMNREAVLAVALNTGNESNLQRLLGGEGWTEGQIRPVLASMTTADWQFVQSVWDYFEGYRPEIAAKERRIMGKEPNWIDPAPRQVTAADGTLVSLRGGYYPVKYDSRASERAEAHADAEGARQQIKGAYTSATTRRSFTKSRVEEVNGRPLLYSLDGIYNGVQEVIHDLSWHEYLIDANRLTKDKKIAGAMRGKYGPEAHQQFKAWLQDVAQGEQASNNAGEKALGWIRQGVSVSGLGMNLMSAVVQPLGLTQSITRIGAKYVGRGLSKYIGAPLATADEINGKSDFMRTRAMTRLRELAEIRGQVKGKTKVREAIDGAAYYMMMRAQQMVDIPTWWGGYEKAIGEGNAEERAVALADQAVIDSQGSGGTKDLSAIERGGAAQKLFTTFYSFFNTALNLGVQKTMNADGKAQLAADYLLLYVVPVILGMLLKDALTPGDAGDDDPKKLAKRLAGEEISYLFGLMFGIREIAGAVQVTTGTNQYGSDYSGPAGVRPIADLYKLGKQTNQGELDDGLRKAIINTAGQFLRLPSAQINRSINGAQALAKGKTHNPGALLTGYQEP